MNSDKAIECRNCVHWRMFSDDPKQGICGFIIHMLDYDTTCKIDGSYDPLRLYDEFCNNFKRQE